MTHIFLNVVEHLDLPHLVPVKILGPQVGEEDGGDEGDAQAEAAACQRWIHLLQGGGIQDAVLDVSLHKPGSHSHALPKEGSCKPQQAPFSFVELGLHSALRHR